MKHELCKIGRDAYAAVKELVDDLERHPQSERAREAIHEDPLSIEVRSNWYVPGARPRPDVETDGEFRILLGTGGPAIRIEGELENGEPIRARLEVQDWGTPWTEYPDADEDVLLTYARVFYWGG